MIEAAAGGIREVLLAGESNLEKPDIAEISRHGFIALSVNHLNEIIVIRVYRK